MTGIHTHVGPRPLSSFGQRYLKKVRFATFGRRIFQSVTTPRPVGAGCVTRFLSVPRQGVRTVGSVRMDGPDRRRQGRGEGGREPKGGGRGSCVPNFPALGFGARRAKAVLGLRRERREFGVFFGPFSGALNLWKCYKRSNPSAAPWLW
jgi:hypothetical protein